LVAGSPSERAPRRGARSIGQATDVPANVVPRWKPAPRPTPCGLYQPRDRHMPRGGQPADEIFNSHPNALEAQLPCLASPCPAPSGGRRPAASRGILHRPEAFRVRADKKSQKHSFRKTNYENMR
jgi:hypothetical protein